MNSTPTPKAIEPDNALFARADEQLAHAYEQITRADEELARLSDQLAKMERDAARPPSAEPDPQSPPRRPAPRALVGLALVACVVVAALVWQSSYGGGARLVVARWAPQLVSSPSLPPENAPLPAQPAPSIVQAAAAEAAPPQARAWLRPRRKTPRRQLPQRLPITHSCCKRWRAISRMWSETSNSSRRTSNK